MIFPPFLLSIFWGLPSPGVEMSFMHHSYLTEMMLTSIVRVTRHMCVKKSHKKEAYFCSQVSCSGRIVEAIRTISTMARTLSKMTQILIPLLAMVSYEIVDRLLLYIKFSSPSGNINICHRHNEEWREMWRVHNHQRRVWAGGERNRPGSSMWKMGRARLLRVEAYQYTEKLSPRKPSPWLLSRVGLVREVVELERWRSCMGQPPRV